MVCRSFILGRRRRSESGATGVGLGESDAVITKGEQMKKRGIAFALTSAVVLLAAIAAVAGSPARAAGLCALYTSETHSSSSVTVTFHVNTAGCQVTLTSYQSTINGRTNEKFASGVFGVGDQTLTVPLTCGTDNQVDLFLGPVPPPYPDASTDLQALSITPECTPPPSVCTFTKGYYKNHSAAVTLYQAGLAPYFTLNQALAILAASPSKLAAGQGGALNLAQQVVTALLNKGKGATPSSAVTSAIASAVAGLNIVYTGNNVTSVTSSGIDVGGLTSIIEPFNSKTDCG
jgi:hypothetical protein